MYQRYTNAAGYTSTVYTDGDSDRTLIALRYIADAYPGEPLFAVRGRDLLAIPSASHYLGLTATMLPPACGPVTEAVLADLAVIQWWQAANLDRLKYPDRPRVSDTAA